MNRVLPDKLIRVHTALSEHTVPHAFGGAIALAFYGEPRATRDIDINIALPPDESKWVLDCFSTLFSIQNRQKAEQELRQIAQTRLQWDHTAIDLFFADLPFHQSVALRSRAVDYVGTKLPIISAEDLIVLKAAFNRPKDWLDIEAMFQIQRHALDATYLRRWLSEFYRPPNDLPLHKIEDFIRDYQSGEEPERFP